MQQPPHPLLQLPPLVLLLGAADAVLLLFLPLSPLLLLLLLLGPTHTQDTSLAIAQARGLCHRR